MSEPIAVGIDFSPSSRHAVDAAARLAHDLGARLVLVHAHSAPHLGWAASQEHLDAIAEVLAEVQMDDVIQLSEAWARPLREQGLTVDTVHREGNPAHVLTEAAREHGAGLLVVGHHGWSALKRFILGSVAKDVLEKTPVPVLVVPETQGGLGETRKSRNAT